MLIEESFGIIPLKREGNLWKILLILHKEGNHWGFPKGRAVAGETSLQSAIRELKEETGLEVDQFIQETPLVDKYQFRKKNELVSKTVTYFPAIVTGELVLQELEIRDAKWLFLPDALQVLSFKEGRALCQELMKILKVV